MAVATFCVSLWKRKNKQEAGRPPNNTPQRSGELSDHPTTQSAVSQFIDPGGSPHSLV